MMTILVVDDDNSLRQGICETLQLSGYSTYEAANGKQALLEVLANRPDLILCDVQMPEMNGYELLQQLKADAEFASIPFVFVSASVSHEAMQTGTGVASAFIEKPFSIDGLLTTVSSLLNSAPVAGKQ